jgi:hypothetical protein
LKSLVAAIAVLDKKWVDWLGSYNELAFGTANRPSEMIPRFTYNFNHMTSEKGRFTSKAAEVRKIVDSLKKPSITSDDDFQSLKDTYLNSITNLETSYDLALQSWRVIAEDKDGIGSNDISISQAFLEDSMTEYRKISPERTKTTNLIGKFIAALSDDRSKGCLFTLNNDRTIATTIQAELDFTRALPSVVVSTDYPPSSAVVTIKTDLPIEVKDGGGKTTNFMWLVCNGDANPMIYDAARTSANAVSATVTKSSYGSFITRQCSFVYRVEEESIYSKSVEVRI